MKKIFITALIVAAFPFLSSAADTLAVKAVNKLQIARAAQTIEITAQQLAPLGENNLNKIHVKDSDGKELLVQAVDTDYDDYHKPDVIIFQSDFAPGETKTFTVSAGATQRFKPEDYKAYGRFVRERFDDFAWENDLIAHRTYGKALETWKGEPLTSSSIDIWSKLAPKLVIDEWYMMGDEFYHTMTDNGGDDYSAGATRGDGGNGLWAADKLWVSKNFVNSRTLTAGPIRVMFELDYEPFYVDQLQVAETMRVTLDAGSQMDHYQVTFKPNYDVRITHLQSPLIPAIGLKKVKGEQVELDSTNGALTVWQAMEKNRGMQGIAAIVDPKKFLKQAEDKSNNLLIVNGDVWSKPEPTYSIDYWAGFAWDKAGKITSADDWKKYVNEFAQKVQSPIEITVAAPVQ
jgi:Domain of unknown function (DUF4861)